MYEDAHQQAEARFNMNGPDASSLPIRADLQPCPFCGTSEFLLVEDSRTYMMENDPTGPEEDYPHTAVVFCQDCIAYGPICETETQATERWEKRLPPEGATNWGRITVADLPDGELSITAHFEPQLNAKDWGANSFAIQLTAVLLQHAREQSGADDPEP